MAPFSEPCAPVQAWLWDQHWRDVLFLHWRVAPAILRGQVPDRLQLDTHDGAAWVSLVLFRMHVRRRGLPFLPGLSSLVEVNLRTYVHGNDRPGIWFLSAHADNRWAIRAARLLTPMPYVYAALDYQPTADGFRGTASEPGLSVAFRPLSSAVVVPEGTLDAWLLERDRLFVQDRRARWLEACVVHPRWEAQPVALSLSTNELGKPFGLDLARPPEQAHFSPGVRALFRAFRPLGSEPEA